MTISNRQFVEDMIANNFAANTFTFDQLMEKIDTVLTPDQVKRAMRDMPRLIKKGNNTYRFQMRGKV